MRGEARWDWGWHSGDVPMRGWGLVFAVGALAVYFGIMLWYKRRHR